MSLLPLFLLLGGGALTLLGIVAAARYAEAQGWRSSLAAYSLRLPLGLSVDDVAAWLATVNAATHAPLFSLLNAPPVALELRAMATGISHVLLVPDSMREALLGSLRSCLPGVRVEVLPDYLRNRPRLRIAAEATISNPRRPLASERAATASHNLLASVQPLGSDEQIIVQWIMTGGGIPRPVPSASTNTQQAWFVDGSVSQDSEAIRAARLKQKEPLLQTSVRVGIATPNLARAYSLFGNVWKSLRIMNAPGAGVVRRWWLPVGMVADRMQRLAVPLLFWPLLVNTRELAGLLGFPVDHVRLPGVSLGAARQLPVPSSVARHGLVLGTSNYPGTEQRTVALRSSDRLRHTWIVGPTGLGKSTLLGNMIVQDMDRGSGMAVIDARGDLIQDMLARVPEHRKKDVVLLDPSRTDMPIGFNILALAKGEQGRDIVVDHVLHIFQDLYRSSWGPRTADVLRASLLTLMLARAANGYVFTLVELPELLTNARFRRTVVRQSPVEQHRELGTFWRWYESLSEAERNQVIGPVLNKLRAFTLKTPLRLLLGQSEGFDLNTIFTQRKIVLCPLSRGLLGPETTELLGSLLVASIWQLTLGRVRIPVERRRPVWLYADEFQETVRLPIDLADMLAQARGLGLGLTLAHQHLGQLPDSLKTAVLGTTRTQLAFQLDYDDATTLSRSFAPLTSDDLMGLERFEIAARLCVDGRTLSPVTVTTVALPEPSSDAAALIASSQQQYGTARTEVEAALLARIANPEHDRQPGRERRGGTA